MESKMEAAFEEATPSSQGSGQQCPPLFLLLYRKQIKLQSIVYDIERVCFQSGNKVVVVVDSLELW